LRGRFRRVFLVDSSIVGLGELACPIVLKIEEGLPVNAIGERIGEWFNMPGDSKVAGSVAESGIGTGPHALLTAHNLEDAEDLGTTDVAPSSSHTFGGRRNGGRHLDAVVIRLTPFVDERRVVDKGKVLV
jgi:hypothetical protein